MRDLGVGRMKLLGSPRRMPSMAGYGLEVNGFVEDEPPVVAAATAATHAQR
jgi:3,4-dihydroxy 2-butanone 4-phosphate synthase/GTP cyclohydrolase II